MGRIAKNLHNVNPIDFLPHDYARDRMGKDFFIKLRKSFLNSDYKSLVELNYIAYVQINKNMEEKSKNGK